MTIEIRSATEADTQFVRQVFLSVRTPEFRFSGLAPQELAVLLDMQFRAQQSHYANAYPEREAYIVVQGGVDIGYWLIARLAQEIRLVDVSLLPDYRGHGVGTYLLTQLLDEAREGQLPVVLHVEMNNPAKRLYGRFGFTVEDEVGIYWRMRWLPS